MSEQQMMQACPKYDAERTDCNPCRHRAEHEWKFPVCDIASGACPACTTVPAAPEQPCSDCGGDGEFDGTPPVPCPSCQPQRKSARERIEQEFNKGLRPGRPVPEGLWGDAAIRVIEQGDAREDALRAECVAWRMAAARTSLARADKDVSSPEKFELYNGRAAVALIDRAEAAEQEVERLRELPNQPGGATVSSTEVQRVDATETRTTGDKAMHS